MGFGTKLCKWLRFCYSTSTFSVLINGSPFGYFSSSRGVRPGCTVSPLLFNIAMEGFSRYMDRASNIRLFSGFSVSPTGLKVTNSKTRLIAIGDVPEISLWASELGCATDNLPFMYLGMPLGAKTNSKQIWNTIIEKFE
ncbi:uncharacterized protein LOC113326531 [Papaver somniferum]|uniref:uncharacterized protein LOC113326531 n=1 Tax=Papaver somniferum TaxID=3469 RepID=UPI000E704C0C|nr:uncharacterized protein LOC113326531 [Papaver somniferum]